MKMFQTKQKGAVGFVISLILVMIAAVIGTSLISTVTKSANVSTGISAVDTLSGTVIPIVFVSIIVVGIVIYGLAGGAANAGR